MPPTRDGEPALGTKTLLTTWWPLAASWLLMGAEVPMVAAAVSRVDDAEIHLAAFGGVVFPIALVIESPIIMMLAAATALCTDQASYVRLKRFTWRLAAGLTLLQAVIALTPLFDLIARTLVAAPPETIEPARLGLLLLLPWTWAIADRRLHQGLLIRFGRQRQVGAGTIIRLVGTAIPLTAGVLLSWPGVVIVGVAMCTGVLAEAIFARWCARPVRLGPLQDAPAAPRMTTRELLSFYVPLAMTPFVMLLAQPIGSAGMSRMSLPLASLAAWPVLNGLVFLVRSTGVAYNEVAVRHGAEPGAAQRLTATAWLLGIGLSLVLLIIALTPLSAWWFGTLSGLEDDLTALACAALPFAVVLPLVTFLQSAYQGLLVVTRRTAAITEAVVASLVATSIVLGLGVAFSPLPGVSTAMIAITVGSLAQVLWLRYRCRDLLAARYPQAIRGEAT